MFLWRSARIFLSNGVQIPWPIVNFSWTVNPYSLHNISEPNSQSCQLIYIKIFPVSLETSNEKIQKKTKNEKLTCGMTMSARYLA